MTFKSDFLPKSFCGSVTKIVVKLLRDQCQTGFVALHDFHWGSFRNVALPSYFC